MQMTIDVLLLGLVLTVLGLFLTKWQPPIKPQFVFILLAVIGMVLGWYMLNGFYGLLWGWVYTGLVFYKNDLVDAIHQIKSAFFSIKNDTDDILNYNQKEEPKEPIKEESKDQK